MNSRYPAFTVFVWMAWIGLVPSLALADRDCVRFDIPSMTPACDISTEQELAEGTRLVEIVIPVSVLAGCDEDQRILELMVQVRGLGAGLHVVDYAPRTQLYSEIDGPVSVENREDTNATLGINADGTAADMVKLNAKLGTGKTKGTSERYHRIPEQKLLLASGTISRGRGAYFKFRHSPQTTLEGGHEIILTLRVPATWRGGMLRVDCQATGKEPYLIGEGDFTAGNMSFVVATWLKGDVEARSVVEQYVALESRLRHIAVSTQQALSRKREKDPIGRMLGFHEWDLPTDWTRRVMLYDSKSIQEKIKPHLPKSGRKTAEKFLASRSLVLRLAK